MKVIFIAPMLYYMISPLKQNQLFSSYSYINEIDREKKDVASLPFLGANFRNQIMSLIIALSLGFMKLYYFLLQLSWLKHKDLQIPILILLIVIIL